MRKYLPHIFIISFAFFLTPAVSLADADRIFKLNNKAVVVVTAYDEKGNAISQGSGFIVRRDGAVVTNYHVISKARSIKVKAGDKVFDVEGLIFTDKENDLVILKARAKNMPVVKLGVIEKANIGEHIYVISSPVGLENTISDGLLSGIREIDEKRKILQITAPVSPGSSGGPVFNRNGEVIGVVTMLIKEAQNLNFAMPVKLIKDKIRSKRVTEIKGSGVEDYERTAEFWATLGYHYDVAAMYKEAIESYKHVIRIDPDWAVVYTGLGHAYSQLDMYKEAADAFKQRTRMKPVSAEAYSNLGSVYTDLGMYKEAIDACKKAIRNDPDWAAAHNNLGYAYVKSGRNREAIEACKQAIMLDPDDPKTYSILGGAYSDLGMKREAFESFKQVIKIDPNRAKDHSNLGLVYMQLATQPSISANACNVYVFKAIDAFKQAIRIDPDYANAHYLLGITYLQINDRGSAIEQYKILKKLDTEMGNELFNLIYKE